ncbi:hypothetical protein Tco_0224845 [Tanacetum coccineum]
MTNTPIGAHTTGVQNVRDSMDMLPTWKLPRMFTQEHVEDLQLAIESYQKKINLTRPDTTRPDLRKITPYTGYPNVQGIIYQDELSRNRLMRTDELHKFSDGTLNHVRTTLNDICSIQEIITQVMDDGLAN